MDRTLPERIVEQVCVRRVVYPRHMDQRDVAVGQCFEADGARIAIQLHEINRQMPGKSCGVMVTVTARFSVPIRPGEHHHGVKSKIQAERLHWC